MSAAGGRPRTILVWDAPTRLFHWLLVLSFAGAFFTADSERHRDLHVTFGATMLVLIAFRLVWGVVGTRYARFGAFAFGPRAVLRYLAALATLESPARHLGHTPAGSWAIWLMLSLGVLVGITGFAAYDEVAGKWVEEAHAALAWTLLAAVGVHVAGVLLSSALHRENLVGAMITGRKRGEAHQGIPRARWLVGAGLAALILALWLDVVSFPGVGRGGAKVAHESPARAAPAEDD
jgi:cytochrome b